MFLVDSINLGHDGSYRQELIGMSYRPADAFNNNSMSKIESNVAYILIRGSGLNSQVGIKMKGNMNKVLPSPVQINLTE